MPDPRHPRGLIDTSVVIDLERIEAADLPAEIAVSRFFEIAGQLTCAKEPKEQSRLKEELARLTFGK